MKKFIPLLTILGVGSALLSGCNFTVASTNDNSLEENLRSFQNQVNEYSNTNENGIEKTILNKYSLTFSVPENATRVNASDIDQNLNDGISTLPYFDEETKLEMEKEKTQNNNNSQTNNSSNVNPDNNLNENSIVNQFDLLDESSNEDIGSNQNNNLNSENINPESEDTIVTETNDDSEINNDSAINENNTSEQISTLYSLSLDINENCDEFCDLRDDIMDAILETKNLIAKLQNKEIELTPEQRIFITNQSNQLKSLGKQLSMVTSELNLNLSDIATLMQSENGQIDNLNLKYLIVLNNLVNGNEMLRNGLSSLYMINQIFNSDKIIPPNNTGRILYGFKKNNEDPIIKDYLIDNDGNVKENLSNNDSIENDSTDSENSTENNTTTTNIDTYQNNRLNSNIDTFYNTNKKNIDTFFNTAWLNNMNRGYNGNYYGSYNNYDNPYADLPMGQPNYYPDNPNARSNNNTTNSVDNSKNTQNTQENSKKIENKKFKLTKNIDTYKNDNTPSLSTRFKNFKESFSKFFSKISKPNKGIEKPLHNLNDNNGSNELIDETNNNY